MAITEADIRAARDAVLECIAVLDRTRSKLFNTWGDWANSSSVSTPDPIPIIDEALKAISAHDVAARAQHIEMFQLLARANPECEVLDVIQGPATAATYTERAWKEMEFWERQSQSTRAMIVEAKEHPHFRALRKAIAGQIEYLNECWRRDSSGTIRRIEVEADRAIEVLLNQSGTGPAKTPRRKNFPIDNQVRPLWQRGTGAKEIAEILGREYGEVLKAVDRLRQQKKRSKRTARTTTVM